MPGGRSAGNGPEAWNITFWLPGNRPSTAMGSFTKRSSGVRYGPPKRLVTAPCGPPSMGNPVGVIRVDMYWSVGRRRWPPESKVRSAVTRRMKLSGLMPAAARFCMCSGVMLRLASTVTVSPGFHAEALTRTAPLQTP